MDSVTGGFDSLQPWLLRQKAMLPDPVVGFVDRTPLAARCDPMQRRMTVIHAPGGFGKTTLLAAACRHRRERGEVVAWLTLDEEDDPKTLATYLWFAFAESGLDILGSRATSGDFERGDYRINLLIHSIEVHGAPCALALDDLHRLRNPESLAIVNRLLQHAPPNLHFGLASRELPAELDVATPLLQGRGIAITVDDLRFGKPDIARFFGTRLSRRELTEITETSRGWPIALCIHRNVGGRGDSTDVQEITANWIESRLWHGLSDEDQDFVLDIGLFDWMDADLVDEVLPAGSMRRIGMIPVLAGLVQSVGGTSRAMYLHPLVRQYCAERRLRETPERYRSIHRAIAKVVARGGNVVVAMHHAVEAQDPRLVGEIVEGAGGFRIWLLEGLVRLRSVEILLTSEVLALFPRLGLLRCIGLIVAGELEAARDMYADLHTRTEGFTRDRDGGDNRALQIDDVAFRYLLMFCGCQGIATPEVNALASSIEHLAEDKVLDPFVQGIAMHAIGELELTRTNFGRAHEWLTRARAQLVRRSRYMTMHVDWRLGTLAMVEGRVDDAAKAYARSQRSAKDGFLREAGPTVIADVLATELNLERNKIASPPRRLHKAPAVLAESGAWLDAYAAAIESAVQLALEDGRPADAEAEIEQASVFAERTERTTLTRCLVSWRVSLLVAADRAEEAQHVWSEARLPEDVDALVDLDGQTWREMEAISCAALRLYTVQSRFDAARELVHAMLAVCAERGLKRTRMRGLALAMVLEHRAGNPIGASAHLAEYIGLFADTDYARPLVQEREVSLATLNALLESGMEQRLHNIVASLRGVLENRPRELSDDNVPALTEREHEILQRLERWRDKEIGAALDLSEDGVRYHVKKIFQKLGVRSRFEATHRARSLGILRVPAGEVS